MLHPLPTCSCGQGKENLHLEVLASVAKLLPALPRCPSGPSPLRPVHAWLTRLAPALARGSRLCVTPCEKAAQGTES